MKWFRVYHDVLDDPKFATLPLEVFGAWVAILGVASQMEPRGTLPSLEEIAFRTRRPVDTLTACVEVMLARKILVKDRAGNLKVYKWDEYQPKSDRVSDRVRKHREKVKKDPLPDPETTPSGPPETLHETLHETPLVTNETLDVTLERRGEEIRREDYGASHLRLPPPSPSRNPAPVVGVGGDDPKAGLDLKGFETFVRSPGHRAAVDAARSALGDPFAMTVAEMGRAVEDLIGDRWDCFVAAVDAAARCTRPIDNLYTWCLRAAEGFARNGIPPPPVGKSGPAAAPAAPALSAAQRRYAEQSAAARRKGELARAALAAANGKGSADADR